MAAGTAVSLVVAPPRARVSFVQRFLGTLLITFGIAVAIGVPLLLSGITGFTLWVGTGKSMEPTFYAGDFLITRDVPTSEIQPGDVVLFKEDLKHVMHRVVSVSPAGDQLITRGDNNDIADTPVPANAVVGRLVYDISWMPRSPVDLSGTGIFVAEWLVAVTLVSLGIIVKRQPARLRGLSRAAPAPLARL